MDYYDFLAMKYEQENELPMLYCRCSRCGENIFDGDAYYRIGDQTWCECCIENAKDYAMVEAPVYELY